MKTSVLIFFIVLSSFGLLAEYTMGQSPENRAKGMVNLLKGILNLTKQQTEEVMQIYVNQYKSRDSLIKILVNRGPNPEVIKSKLTPMIHANELETDKKISSILHSDQKLAYAKFLSYRKPGRIMSVATPVPPK